MGVDSNLRPHGLETCNLTVCVLRCDYIYYIFRGSQPVMSASMYATHHLFPFKADTVLRTARATTTTATSVLTHSPPLDRRSRQFTKPARNEAIGKINELK